MNWMDADSLLGRRFATDFTVVGVGPARPGVLYDADRTVRIRADHGTFRVSLGELKAVIESGFVEEK